MPEKDINVFYATGKDTLAQNEIQILQSNKFAVKRTKYNISFGF